MQLFDKPIEQPWAFAHRKGFKGEAPGLYFLYYATKEEAEKSRIKKIRKKRYAGKVEYRPQESWHAGYIL